MEKPKILITNLTLSKVLINQLSDQFHVIETNTNIEEIEKYIEGVSAIMWVTNHKLTKELIDKAGDKLKVVTVLSSGYDFVDTEELKKRNIRFGNVANISTKAVANQAVLLALAASRRLRECRLALERGNWTPCIDFNWMLGKDIEGTTIGIIGFGGIGQAIANKMKAFDISKILYTGHSKKNYKEAEFVNLETLLKQSDFVFICCPLTKETEYLCNKSFFDQMKPNSVFVNIGRGRIVKEEDLIEALKSGKLFGAGLDVTCVEPLDPDSELLKLPNLVLTPHIGSATSLVRAEMCLKGIENILKGLRGEKLLF